MAREKKKTPTLTVRLDEKTQDCLDEIVRVRGVDKSEAARMCIRGVKILQIGNVTDLAQEFFKIRVALEKNDATEDLRKEVQYLCQCMSDLLHTLENPEE